MNNFKKVGLTALAGSLMASSVAVAGELAVTGGAEISMTNRSQSAAGKTIAMANSVNFAGSGETDGGLTVSLSFELDHASQGDGGPFDNHSVSVGSDSLGTLTVHGHGGSNAAAAVDATAAGDLWDNTLGITTAAANAGLTPKAGPSNTGLVVYTLPSLADGVSVSASYDSAGQNDEGSGALGLTYTGVEGLTVKLGSGSDQSNSQVEADYTTMSASYAYGSFTIGLSSSEYDHTTASKDQEVTSWGISYTVNDDISISYGQETIENNLDTADVEVDGISASYTSGGMTVTATSIGADNVDGSSTGVNNDNEFFKLSASFAF
jgi:outer membrane protein OmpU